MGFMDRLQHGWNAFIGRDPTPTYTNTVFANTLRPDHITLQRGNERSMITAALNRIAVDVASITIDHARLDENDRYKESMNSKLHECLTLAANADQTARAFIEDAAMSLLDEGVIAIVPTEATENPMLTSSFDIGSLRIGKVVEWYPQHVKVNLYNEFTGQKEDRIFPKAMVALPENPFYHIMNEPNSIYQRLMRKIRMLDVIDEQNSSGKLDLILQLPYIIRTDARRREAENRRKDIEMQLTGSKYGIAYIDGTEKITQLNRSVENNLFAQIEYYTNLLYSQLGIPIAVFDGTADEQTMLNYTNRTIEPIVSALVDSMKWKFITKKARTQGQSIVFFRDPFKLAPVADIANNADKFIRNEILTKNEFRQIIGFKPSADPTADQLSNPNMPAKDQTGVAEESSKNEEEEKTTE